MTTTSTYFTDPGHGWLSVKRDELVRLKILDKITAYSYQKGDTVYLEEDCDMSTYAKAKEAIDGVKWKDLKMREEHTDEDSPIRDYDSFRMIRWVSRL